MNDKTRTGLYITGAALALGTLGDSLLRVGPWGLNAVVWTAALAGMLYGLFGRARNPLSEPVVGWRSLLACTLVFAALFAWRDSLVLKCLSTGGLMASLSLLTARRSGRSAQVAGLLDYLVSGIVTGINAIFGCIPLTLFDIEWRSLPRSGWTRNAGGVLRGLLLAAPLLLLFGALLVSADAVFEKMLSGLVRVDMDSLLTHLFLTGGITWLAAGYLRGTLNARLQDDLLGTAPKSARQARAATEMSDPPTDTDFLLPLEIDTVKETQPDTSRQTVRDRPELRVLGIIEIGTVLGALNLLFMAFVLIQVRYFFGGASLVQATTGLTYAVYARRGFFELVTVAALALPILLTAQAMLKTERAADTRIFRTLAAMQVILLFVIMGSAVQRMRLYQMEYGLTELRYYTMAFMGWLGLVFAWYLATALRERRERFAYGALLAGFFVIGLLYVLNPDASIARANVARAAEKNRFDAVYAASLSGDAVPVLIDALPHLSTPDRNVLAARLLREWNREGLDWRTWSLGRGTARSLVQNNRTRLFQMETSR